MQVPRPSDDDKLFFRSLIDEDDRVRVKPMFGNLGAFVDGAMFAGLFGSAVGLRLDDAGRAEVLALEGSGPFGPAERPMGGYVSVPPAWRDEPALAREWVDRARAYVETLPPKQPKGRARR
jgi:TfoX/Sxy family transcriptional regulator of competence genes